MRNNPNWNKPLNLISRQVSQPNGVKLVLFRLVGSLSLPGNNSDNLV